MSKSWNNGGETVKYDARNVPHSGSTPERPELARVIVSFKGHGNSSFTGAGSERWLCDCGVNRTLVKSKIVFRWEAKLETTS